MMECPDHDTLIRIKTIIETDHEALKQRVLSLEQTRMAREEAQQLGSRLSALEEHAARATGAGLVMMGIIGIVGIVIGAILQHTWLGK